MDFEAFPKIPRLRRECCLTEKIDGSNAQVCITADGEVFAGSRTRWITPQADNFGFAQWVHDNAFELLKLGPGRHFGEWYGAGIQRRYGLTEKRFALFNAHRWGKVVGTDAFPSCCHVVPVLYNGVFSDKAVADALDDLRAKGSRAVPGFMQPEGVVVFMSASQTMHKVLLENDDIPKGAAANG